MVAKVVRAGGWASWMGECSTASWIRCLAVASLVLVAVAIVLETSRMGRLIAAWPAETAAITMLGLAGLAALASHKAVMALAARLEMSSWALELGTRGTTDRGGGRSYPLCQPRFPRTLPRPGRLAPGSHQASPMLGRRIRGAISPAPRPCRRRRPRHRNPLLERDIDRRRRPFEGQDRADRGLSGI